MAKKEWSATIAQNKRLYPAAWKMIGASVELYTRHAGTRPVELPEFIRNYKRKEYKTTNAEEAKRLGVTARQVSKMRNGKVPFPGE